MYTQPLLLVLSTAFISSVFARPGQEHSKRGLTPGSYPAWSYAGCYTDTPQARGLGLGGYTDSQMTEAKCIQYCDQRGFGRAGTEFGQECFCGYEVQSTSTLSDDSNCNYACPGNTDQPCGGYGYMTVFSNGVSQPREKAGPAGWTSLGCYTDNVSARSLNTTESSSDGIEFVEACTQTCGSLGFLYAGLEYGRECYCGNAILNGGAPASSGCNMACTGDHTELCGGPNRLNLYMANKS